MPGATRVLNFVMKGNTMDFTRKWNGASATMNRVGTQAQTLATGLGTLGATMSTRFTLPIIAGLGLGVKAFGDFDKAMTQSLAIMGDVSEKTEKQMASLATQMSTESTFAARELAQSYFFLASAGLDAAQSMKALPVVTKFAEAGAFEMSQATDLLTDAYSALGPQIQKTGDLMTDMTGLGDLLVKANTLANASVLQFSEALTNQAGPAMRAYGIEVEDGVATLAAYADQGIKGNIAGSMFGRALRLLAKAATTNSDEFKKMGIEVFDAEGNFRSFALISKDLETAMAGLGAEQRTVALSTLGFKARTQQAILPLIGASQKIDEYRKKLKQAGGIMEEVANKQLEAFSNKITMVKNNVVNAFRDMGQAVIPTVTKIAEKINSMATAFQDLSPETKKIASNILLFTASIGPLLLLAKGGIGIFVGLLATMNGVGSAVVLLSTKWTAAAAAKVAASTAEAAAIAANTAAVKANMIARIAAAKPVAVVTAAQIVAALAAGKDTASITANTTATAANIIVKKGSISAHIALTASKKAATAATIAATRAVMISQAAFAGLAVAIPAVGLAWAKLVKTTLEWRDAIKGLKESNRLLDEMEAKYGSIASLREITRKKRSEDYLKEVLAGGTKKLAKPSFVMTADDITAQKNFQNAAKQGSFNQLSISGKINSLLKDRVKLANQLDVLDKKGLANSVRSFELEQKFLEGEFSLRDLLNQRKEEGASGKSDVSTIKTFAGAFERGSVEDYRARISQSRKNNPVEIQKQMDKELKKQTEIITQTNDYMAIMAEKDFGSSDLIPVTIGV